MTRELFNVAELIAAALIGGFVVGVVVFIATAWMRREAFADRADAAADLAAARAAQIAMEASRSRLVLAPAYAADTAQFEMIRDDRPEPDAPTETACCTGHGDEPCAPDSGLVPPCCCGDCPDWRPGTDLVPVGAVPVDEPPVTADDLASIGPAQMPAVSWRGVVLLVVVSVPVLVVLVLLAVAWLVWLGWDRAGEWRADRRRRETDAVVMELAHPAPVSVYDARHRAPAGRWRWSR